MVKKPDILIKFKLCISNCNLHSKFLMIMIPCSILSSIIIMVSSFYVFEQYEDKLYQSTVQSLNISVDNIEAELSKIESITGHLITDATLQSALRFKKPNIRGRETSSEYHALAVEFYQLLKDEYDNNAEILSISVFVDDEWYYVGQLPRKIDDAIFMAMEDKLSGDYKNSAWFPDSYPGDRMFYVRNIKEVSGNFRTLGRILVECDFQSIIKAQLKENRNLNYAPNIQIYNEDGKIYADLGQEENLEKIMEGRPYCTVTVEGEKYFASYTDDSIYSWHCITLLPFNDVFGSVTGLKIIFILVDFLVIVITVLFCRTLIFSLTRHFDYLVEKMRSVRSGDFHMGKYPSYAMRNDEIGFIHQSFDKMVKELEKLIQDNYVKQLLIQESKLKMLQQQINPHFLFNTLQTVNWKAKDNKPQEVSQIAEALGKLLRYTLSEEEDPVSLGEELKIVGYYVDIQKLRYQERLKVIYDIPEHLHQQRLPKLSLQNVVENSIKYALEAILEPCVIKIWTREEENTFHLYVEDNGPGIEEDALEKAGKEQAEKQIYGLGIGLSNISQRIKLLFSEEYSLVLHNTGKGTMVEFYLPKTGTGMEVSTDENCIVGG
jgi:two-component system sensor histidine kinase YesM